MNKEEFIKLIESCKAPSRFDQHFLDLASEMFAKWGVVGGMQHMKNKEYLFEQFGLNSGSEESEAVKAEKAALRCVCTQMMREEAKLNRKDAADLIRNYNKFM